MKRIILTMILAVSASFIAFGQIQDEARLDEKSAQELARFESDWLTASLNRDQAWLKRFLAGRLIVTSSTSEMVDKRAQEIVGMIDPALSPQEMKVRITGNITVLTNNTSEAGGNRSYSFLDTFNKRGDKWQIIASNFSRVPYSINESDEQAVRRLKREWSDAIVKRDIASLRRIIADDFTGIESTGRVIDKAQFINGIASGAEDVQSANPEDIKVRVHGDAAVITGRHLVKGVKKEGSYSPQILFTDIWTKRNGNWQVVNYQATHIH